MVSLPAGATGVEADVDEVEERVFRVDLLGANTVGLEGFGLGSSVAVVGLVSCDVGLFTPLDADVDVDGTEETIICSPLVIGIVETWVSPTVLEGIGFGGYPSFTKQWLGSALRVKLKEDHGERLTLLLCDGNITSGEHHQLKLFISGLGAQLEHCCSFRMPESYLLSLELSISLTYTKLATAREFLPYIEGGHDLSLTSSGMTGR